MHKISVAAIEPADLGEVLALQRRAFGPGRFSRSTYRVREGTQMVSPFDLLARVGGELVAAVHFTPVSIGGQAGALLLGPLAVEERYAGLGYGKRLVAEGLDKARAAGVKLVVLVGDEPYYARFGFAPVPAGRIQLPGPVDPSRLLAAELEAGALARYAGSLSAEADR